MPNTCVKVSTPETYVGFAVAPLVDTKVTWESTQNKKEGHPFRVPVTHRPQNRD
ncbi:MAG: hypothetical protein J6Y37_04490 [Paludibacteraceae bacterium]|nr:hypothetical protein [Paludibacteraceae bacterium]